MPEQQSPPTARYLPTEPDSEKWGIYVADSGFASVKPGADYPSHSESRPSEYRHSWKAGRTLDEYQLVYITEGRGTFESEPTGRVSIEGGHVFLLFPGVWHRFRPIKREGWEENWIGFNGDIADRVMKNFFSPQKAVIRVGPDQELLHQIRSIVGLMDQAPVGYQQIVGSRTLEILAHIRSHAMSYRSIDRQVARKVEQARRYLVQHYSDTIDTEALAHRLGFSLSRFRAVFKEHTGAAPNQYQIDIRMNLARHWLAESHHTVTEIAEMLGFSSVYYFSRLFKKKEGCPPSAYRKR
ncbi:MAG: AraC family transcriptional regulator [Verrucomicrobia bacterium]|jgi:AraC-like DNA-binding protein|nr:AraC family transcriptional regulator [Verrucomicrobiota bacterium]